MRRVAVTVASDRAEEARARVLELFPEGFEELERADALELVVYTDGDGERRLRAAFEAVEAAEVPEDWPDRWMRFHRGARVGDLWVGPPWEPPPRDAVAVLIEPGRAFGTGGHPTTRLCLDFLQSVPRASLLDVGCGSGVLAVAGARLGFAPVFAVDNDPDAVDATRENAAANGVTVEARVADAFEDELPRADVAVANIAAEAVPWLGLRAPLVIVSGYLAGDEPRPPGYDHVERRRLDGWAADLFRRRA
jgi:ribosomal protein L11 methyltransferase